MTGPATVVTVDQLRIEVYDDASALAAAAAGDATRAVRDAIARDGSARVMFATGNSQLAMLAVLADAAAVDWSRVDGFQIDEYVRLPADHPAHFGTYLGERVARPLGLRAIHLIDGLAEPTAEAARYAALLAASPIDVCLLGIGENGHLGFNDPPADLDDPADVRVVALDDRCRRQQVGEGHFATVGDVPSTAITVTVPALLRARRVLAIVPDARKAEAVQRALEGPIHGSCPASALRRAPHATLYVDRDSAGSSSVIARAATRSASGRSSR